MLKKWIVGILVAGMVLVAGAAYGDYHPIPGDELPTSGEVAVYEYNYDLLGWVLITDDLDANAKCFAGVPDLNNACNKQVWPIEVDISASVTQWVEWSMTGTDWEWFVRKPGKYGANCITATLISNYDVCVDYEGFEDLLGSGGIDDTISIFYAESGTIDVIPDQLDFISAADLNYETDRIVDHVDLHTGISWKLWNYIIVEACNSACEYADPDGATITLTLQGVKNWIDPTFGTFDEV